MFVSFAPYRRPEVPILKFHGGHESADGNADDCAEPGHGHPTGVRLRWRYSGMKCPG
jgi:hypothetical protein